MHIYSVFALLKFTIYDSICISVYVERNIESNPNL